MQGDAEGRGLDSCVPRAVASLVELRGRTPRASARTERAAAAALTIRQRRLHTPLSDERRLELVGGGTDAGTIGSCRGALLPMA